MRAEESWRGFPKTLAEFDERFPDEAACRAHLIELRWGGRVRCAQCEFDETWELQNGRFECKKCGHQTSVTAGTLLTGPESLCGFGLERCGRWRREKGESTPVSFND